jgi:hypothetical protein
MTDGGALQDTKMLPDLEGREHRQKIRSSYNKDGSLEYCYCLQLYSRCWTLAAFSAS